MDTTFAGSRGPVRAEPAGNTALAGPQPPRREPRALGRGRVRTAGHRCGTARGAVAGGSACPWHQESFITKLS